MFKLLKRSLSVRVFAPLLVGIIAFIPRAMADDDLIFNPTPPAQYVVGGDSYPASVKMTNYTQPTTVKFKVGKKGVVSPTLIETYKFEVNNEAHKFEWDGKIEGVAASLGNYELMMMVGEKIVLQHDFMIKDGPKISFTKPAPTQHILGSGEYKVSVDLKDYAKETTVTAAVILSDAAIYIPQAEHTYKANGTHEFSWDVSNYKPGNYAVKFYGVDTVKSPTNSLEYELKILEAQPTLTFIPAPASTYKTGEGDYKASVQLTNFTTNTLVTVHVVDLATALDTAKDNFTFTANSETHPFALNMDAFKAGDYELRFYGEDLNKIQTNVLIQKLKITDGTPLQVNLLEQDSCAGYKDLKKTDWSCDAAVWAKDQGIITGQAGGDYFDGYSFLNRAEQTKIALMAYNKYSANTDYCKGSKPFLDVLLGQWYTPYICLGKDLKALTGYLSGDEAGKFVPARAVTVPEMFCILLRPLNETMPQGPSYPGLASNQWYSSCAKYAKDKGYYTAATLSPTKEATRFEVLNFLYAIHKDGKL